MGVISSFFFDIAADCRYFEDHQAIFGGRVSALEQAGEQNSCIFCGYFFLFALQRLWFGCHLLSPKSNNFHMSSDKFDGADLVRTHSYPLWA